MNFFQRLLSQIRTRENFKPVSRSESWKAHEIAEFIKNLKQVIKWTEKLAYDFDFKDGNYGTVFRQTNPLINKTRLYTIDVNYATWNLDDYNPAIYDQLLELAVNSRDKEFYSDLQNIDDLGRILGFQTCTTTHDGAPIVNSQCFVDESDVPPIDTWFYLKRNCYECDQMLFCWIPKAFENIMQDAIDVEIFDSYRWFNEDNFSIYKEIKNSG